MTGIVGAYVQRFNGPVARRSPMTVIARPIATKQTTCPPLGRRIHRRSCPAAATDQKAMSSMSASPIVATPQAFTANQ